MVGLTDILLIALSGINTLTLMLVVLVSVTFVVVFFANRFIIRRVRATSQQTQEVTSIMQHALGLGNIYVLHFLSGPRYVHNLYGELLPEKSLSFDEFFRLVHPDDCAQLDLFIRQLIDRTTETGEFEFRIKVAGGAGYRNMLCQAIAEANSQPRNVICTLTDETDEVIEQQQEQELSDKYRLIFNHTLVGLAFYGSDGVLLAANQPMQKICKFQGEHDPFYFETRAYDMPLFRDALNRQMTEDIYFCTRAVVPERGVNTYMEIRIHPVMDDIGQLLYISVAARDISEERNLYLQVKQNDAEMRRANEELRVYEGELKYLFENCDMLGWQVDFATQRVKFFKELGRSESETTLEDLCGRIITEAGDEPLSPELFEQTLHQPASKLHKVRSLSGGDAVEWYLMNSVPEHAADGSVKGCFGLVRKVSSLMQAQEQLKRETERANDSGRLKSVFMANMTHEIRTPLNSIVGFSDLLPAIESADDKREMIRVIMNNCDMLLRLINDILEISSMDANAISMEPEDVDFAQRFNDVAHSLAERVQEPAVTYQVDSPYDTFPTTLDFKRVQQVITNFVTNAVKYTHEGHIKVGYRYEEGGLYVYCEDTGEGIPKENQERVFERFVKLNDYVQGTGLGLSICKAIANRMKGRIGVDSEGVGKGSTFWFWIPCDKK